MRRIMTRPRYDAAALTNRRLDWLARAPVAALLLVLLAHLALLLALNGGVLTFATDDAYIHLTLAEYLAKLHYGVNPGEFSAPSSSMLWPILLMPFAGFRWGQWWPFAISVSSAVAVMLMLERVMREILPGSDVTRRAAAAAFAIVLIPVANLWLLIFQGLEQVLQAALTVAVFLGLVLRARRGETPGWLWLAILLGPLVRFESAATSGAALLVLFLAGERAKSVAVGAAIAAVFGAYALYLTSHGLEPLPTSVVAKSGLTGNAGMGTLILRSLTELARGRILLEVLALSLAVCALRPGRPASERGVSAWGALLCGAHAAVGPIGGMDRYENYAVLAGLLALAYALRESLQSLVDRRRWAALAAGAVALLAATYPHLYDSSVASLYCNEIYLQQYQMGRFVRETWQAPIAVNDIGLVSYHNGRYVLDLWGLSSHEALEHRFRQEPVEWMDSLAARHGVELAMIYDSWFPERPANWQRVAQLELRRIRPGSGRQPVAFYVRSPEQAALLREALARFAPTLPAGASVALDPLPSHSGE